MPCSDSSSSIALKFDSDERFISFDFAKITCGREITAKTGYSMYCVGRELPEILKIPYAQAVTDLKLQEEEAQFILYMEWDALRSAIAQYLGDEHTEYDKNRCAITSIEHTDEGIEVAMVILPPKELPKILPCSLSDKQQ
jgi:hypothetical protein